MRINTNVAALNAWRNLTVSDTAMAKSLERLSSGYRIAKASDDAAGLAISEKMKSQIGGLRVAQRNAQDGISMVQTAEGGLTETASILLRMRDLANQATTSTIDNTDREKVSEEFFQLQTELGRISQTTKFNNIALLTGGLGGSIGATGGNLTTHNGIQNIQTVGAAAGNYILTVTGTEVKISGSGIEETIDIGLKPTGFETRTLNFSKLNLIVTVNASLADINADNGFQVTAGRAAIQVGADGNTTLDVEIGDMSADGLGVSTIGVNTADNARSAVAAIDEAIGRVNAQRAKLGAYQNRLEHTIANLGITIENLTSAESRIRDVDMALEMANFTKGQILQQAGTAMLAQANQRPQSIMQLLR